MFSLLHDVGRDCSSTSRQQHISGRFAKNTKVIVNIRWFQISQLKTSRPHTKKTVVLFEAVGEYHLHF